MGRGRSNVMSLEYICAHPALTVNPIQENIRERKDDPLPLSVKRTGGEASSSERAHSPPINPPAVVNDTSIYLHETRVVQLYSPVACNLGAPVLGWTPPDGLEDVDLDKENPMYPSQLSSLASHWGRDDKPEHLTAYQATRWRTRHTAAQLPRTRVVLAPTQYIDTAAQSHPSCGPPKGGIPPKVARDVTKFLALRAEQESKRRRAAIARAVEGRKPSVLR